MRSPIRILSLSILVALASVAIAKKPKAAQPAPAPAAAPAPTPAGTAQATVYKDGVAVHQAAMATSPTVTSLSKGSPVEVEKQEGLWFNVKAQPSTSGYVKINEVRLAKATGAAGSSNDGYSMFGGHVKPTETAGVRGIGETDLQNATFDAGQLARMEALRVDDGAANSYASRMHLQKTQIAYAKEPGIGQGHRSTSGTPEETQAKQEENTAVKNGLFGMIGSRLPGGIGASAGNATDAMPKDEQEKFDEEIAMGPQVAGRVLSVMPLWGDPAAQRRVNTIGRWVAMQTPRDDLPWTFAVVDSPEMNAFAAPGGYIMVTRGLYEVLQSDDEVAAVLGHEISHVVSRDHYNVIRKQAMASVAMNAGSDYAIGKIGNNGGAGPFEQKLAGYFAKQGAKIILLGFDKDVEYRSDGASLIYTSRAGYNPLAMWAVLQKLDAVGDAGRTSNLYKTHPTPTQRLDRLDQKGFAGVAQYTDRPYVAGMR